jgi:hypothetical protein
MQIEGIWKGCNDVDGGLAEGYRSLAGGSRMKAFS